MEGMGTTTVLENPGVDFVEFTVSPVFPTCPVTGEPFAVAVTVQYHPEVLLIEYVEFEEWVRAAVAQPMTLEDLAVVARSRAAVLLGPDTPIWVTAKVVASCHCKATAIAHANWEVE